MARTRKTISWTLSALIHAVILFFVLRAGYRYVFTEGEVVIEPFSTPKGVQVEAKSQSKDETVPMKPAVKKSAKSQVVEKTTKPLPEKKAAAQPPIPLPITQSDTTAPEVKPQEAETEEEPDSQSDSKPESNPEVKTEAKTDETAAEPSVTPEDQAPPSSEPAKETEASESENENPAPQASESTNEEKNETAGTIPKFGTPGSMIDESKLQELPGNRAPTYPPLARTLGQEGDVVIRAYIKKNGTVDSPAVEKSSGHQLLDREALGAYSRYRFKPGVSGWVLKTIRFRFKK